MEGDVKQRPEPDLDKTDRLPILQGIQIAADVADDAVPMDHAATLPVTSSPAADRVSAAGVHSAFDLPSLAQSVRSVEERIARQSADNEALTRAYERACEAEAASGQRVHSLTAELAAARTALETEHGRSLELERLSTERSSAAEAAHVRADEALREAARYQTEAHTLRESLAARDASIAQALHSLGERDAQLSALQQEHARLVPALEANSKSTSQLEADWQAARADANALAAELKASRDQVAALSQELKRGASEISAARQDFRTASIEASSYLELLRTREWRRGFDQNLFLELDARAVDVSESQVALESERERLQHEVAALQARLGTQSAHAGPEQEARIEQLQIAAQAREREARDKECELAELKPRVEETQRALHAIEADVKRLTAELASKVVAFSQFEAENRILRATLERTRDTLEKRELLIGRLERGETDNADMLENIQTRMERLISIPPGASTPAPAARSAELVQIGVANPTTHVLGRRTRIGRATACELQIDSSSVSRHHALVLVGARETVIEDLNSTNGVLVNGRKVTRQVLNDGDSLTFGEARFRYLAGPSYEGAEATPAEPAAET